MVHTYTGASPACLVSAQASFTKPLGDLSNEERIEDGGMIVVSVRVAFSVVKVFSI